jgi:hypothetical protein
MKNEGENKITREALAARLWAEPLKTIARDLGVSEARLKEVCTWLNLPRPPRGHWGQKASDQASEPPDS